jgi:hypothetical protein
MLVDLFEVDSSVRVENILAGIGISLSVGVESMLAADHFPELGTDLVTSLTGLDAHYFTNHIEG